MKFLAIVSICAALFILGCAATAGMIAGYGPIENSWKNEYAKWELPAEVATAISAFMEK